MNGEDDDPVDNLAALRAELDQMLAFAPEIARSARTYFEAFSAEGFPSSQAMYLVAVQITQNPGKAP